MQDCKDHRKWITIHQILFRDRRSRDQKCYSCEILTFQPLFCLLLSSLLAIFSFCSKYQSKLENTMYPTLSLSNRDFKRTGEMLDNLSKCCSLTSDGTRVVTNSDLESYPEKDVLQIAMETIDTSLCSPLGSTSITKGAKQIVQRFMKKKNSSHVDAFAVGACNVVESETIFRSSE